MLQNPAEVVRALYLTMQLDGGPFTTGKAAIVEHSMKRYEQLAKQPISSGPAHAEAALHEAHDPWQMHMAKVFVCWHYDISASACLHLH